MFAPLQAEPLFIHCNAMKPDLFNGNIWNPPIIEEIKMEQNKVI